MKSIISTDQAPKAIGPYSQAIQKGSMVVTSGQLPIHPETGQMADCIKEQTKQSLENVKAILKAKDMTLEHVLKTTVFLSDISDFAAMNEVYQSYFTENYPARSAFEVAKLPMDARVEIEVMAML